MSGDPSEPAAAGPPRGRFTIVFLIHEAFRRDIARLGSAVRGAATEPARAARLRAHWGFIDEQLHHHHQVEDDSLWPLVRPKLAGHQDSLAVLDRMEADHLALQPHSRAVEEAMAAFASGPTAAQGTELADRLDTFGDVLGAHLDAEEVDCFPVIDQALSAEEFESFGKATAKAVGMRGSARFVPWIFDGADPGERQAVLQMPPPPVRLLCRYAWEPRYQRQVAPLWGS
jgi:iron-sulfur cluster repair protein YtfE (RIC family)